MNVINRTIKETFKEMKIKRIKYSPKRNNLPLNIRQMYNQIYQLNSHIALLKERLCLFQTTNNNNLKGNNSLNTLDLIITFNHHWDRKKMWIIKLLNEQTIQFDHTNFNQIISNINQVDYAIYTIKNLIQLIKAKLSIEYTASIPTKIPINYPNDTFQQRLNIKILGYLDDTTWLTDNLDKLQHNLAIAKRLLPTG
ncbi:hypothetical protein RhiirB3_434270 [Rhizophagus irregularis]|nr:hypothetical protein RhiirB3_434270 [Rhizophagus irregularis]